jgi:hypothetical protein
MWLLQQVGGYRPATTRAWQAATAAGRWLPQAPYESQPTGHQNIRSGLGYIVVGCEGLEETLPKIRSVAMWG